MKYRGNQLNALLENWSLYEKMLKDYAEGSGSAMEEAMKSANNWEGSINRLDNTFTKIMNNIVNSDAVITITNSFNSLLTVIDKVTSKLGSLGTIGSIGGAYLGAKNWGLAQVSDGKLQLGGLFDRLKVDIDKYKEIIEEFKTLDLSKKNFLNSDGKANWDEIAKSIKGCDKTALSYFKTLEDGNGKINNQSASVKGLAAHLKVTGQSFDFAAIKATLFNTALNTGILLAISLALQVVIKGIGDYIHRVDNARERSSDLMNEFKQMNNTLAEHKKTVADLSARYDELSKGVDLSDNRNLTLSTDEYEEFLDINEQLASSFPELAKGIDENGNSILALGTSGITAKEQLEELLNTEENLNNFRIAQGLEEAFKGIITYVDEANKVTETLNGNINDVNGAMQKIQDVASKGINLSGDGGLVFAGNVENRAELDYMNALIASAQEFFDTLDDNRRVELYGINLDNSNLFDIETDSEGAFKVYANLFQLTEEEKTSLETIIKDNVKTASGSLLDQINSQTQDLEAKVKVAQNQWRDFIPNLVSGMKSKQTFNDLDSDLQNIAVQIVEGLDYSYANAMSEYDPDPYAYIRDKLIVPMGELNESDKEKIKNSFGELFQLDADDISQRNQEEISRIIKNISDILEKEPVEIRAMLGFDISDAQKNYNTALVEAQKKFGGYFDNFGIQVPNHTIGKDINNFFNENIKSQDDINLWTNVTEGINDAIEAMKAFVAAKEKSDESNASLFSSFEGSEIGERLQYITNQFEEGEISFKEYFDTLNNEIANVDFSNYTNSIEEANAASQQFFTDSIQQTASGLSDLIGKFDSGSISISEYLEGYVSIANTLSTLTDELQENSASWDQNGNAMDNATSEMLDNTQVSLDNAISTIESYQDSIYSLEQIMSGAVEAGTDEFTAHTQVIAEDLANIVASGGEMADEIANTLGTTTSEIASSMSENVSNQNLAAQAIAANTNVAIMDMADSVGQLFDTLGNAISNFKVDVSFDIKKISWKTLDMGILGPHVVPKIDFGLEANGESLSAVGAAISNFGKSVSSNLASQTIDLSNFNFKGDNKYTPDEGVLDNYNKKLGNLKNSHKGTGKAAKDAADEAVDAINEQIDALEREKEAAEEAFQTQIDGIDDLIKEKNKQIDTINDEIDAINDEADAIKKASDARKRDIDLQKAQYDVERAENQRTSLVYTEDKGMIYVPDTEGIRDKREKVTEIQEDIEIANLQKKVDLKKDEIDIIQDEIDALEEQKDLIKEMMEESNRYYENLIKNLREEANEAKNVAQEAEDAARTATGGVGNAIKNLRDTAMEDKSLSYYIWSDDDENALISAQGRLDELNRLIESGVDVERYTKLRDEVAKFVDEYSRLKETRQVTDEFKNSLDALLGSNDIYVNNFLGLVDGVEQRIQTASNYSEKILEYVSKASDAYKDLNDNLDESNVGKTGEELNTLTNTFKDAVIKVTKETGVLNSEASNVSDTVKGTTEDLKLFGINLDNSLLKATENTKLLDDITSKMSSNTGELVEKSSEGFKTVGQIMADSVKNMADFSSSASVVANDIELLKSSMSGLDTAGETIDSVIDEEADKLTNLDESINAVSNSISTIKDTQENINSLSGAFTALGEAIKSVSDALGVGEEGAVSSLVEALNSISNISLSGEDGGIVSEFQNLKTAVKEVSAAVSGGDSKGTAGTSGAGTNESGASSLKDAILELKNTTDEALGSGEEEGGSGNGEGVIGKFTMLKQAVNAVTTAIGIDSEGGSRSEDNENLIGAILAQQEAVSKALPDEKILFEDLKVSIERCVNVLNDMIRALREIQSIGVPGVSGPSHSKGTVGNAFADGYNGLPKDEKNALRSEYGQPELTVYPNGKTELTTEPVMSDLPKGTVIYNEKQTKKILNGKPKSIGEAYAQGTLNSEKIVLPNGQILVPYDPNKDMSPMGELNRKLAVFAESIDENVFGLLSPVNKIQQDMDRMINNNIKNITNTNNNSNSTVNIGDIHVTCPGVTTQEVMRNLGPALDEKFRGFHNYADQMSRIR